MYRYIRKALLALVVHYIDDTFKFNEVLIFAKPFSDVAHIAIKIEKAIKIGLASYGVGTYDPSTDPIIHTVYLRPMF